MLSADKGDRAWRIVRAEAVKDSEGNPAISIELDEVGGRRLGELTESHLNEPLAILINNGVVMVATIVSKITTHVQITGQFEQARVDSLVKAFNAPPASASDQTK